MLVRPIKTRIFKEGEPLVPFLLRYFKSPHQGDIIVVTSKIVALSQGMVVPVGEKMVAIKKVSGRVIPNRWGALTLRNGEWCMNAGADESNAFGKVVLLPKNEFTVAHRIRAALQKKYGIKKIGVILSDTRTMPLKKGTQGIALAYSGVEPLKSYIGKPDLSGRKNTLTEVNVADSIATAAVLAMGEGSESTPLCLVRGASAVFTNEKFTKRNLAFVAKADLYRDAYLHES